MRITQLRYLGAVLDCGSFHGAARALGVSQPTVSQQIQRLEKELGLVLVSRKRGRAVVTAEAQPLLPIIQRILEDERNLRDEASAVRGLRTGTVRIGSITAISRTVLTLALPAYRRTFPQIHFEVIEGGSLMIMERVRSGDLDLGLVSGACDEAVASDLLAIELFRDKAVVCLSRDHPAARRTRVRIRDLAQEPWIVQGEDYMLRQLLTRLAGDTKLNIIYQSNSATSTLHLVAAGIGIAFMGKLSILTSDPDDRRRVALLPIQAPEITLSMIARRDASPPPAVRELRRFLDPMSQVVKRQLAGFPQVVSRPVSDR